MVRRRKRKHIAAVEHQPKSVSMASNNGKFRDECLNEHGVLSVRHAREVIDTWRQEDNDERPPSSLGYLTPTRFAQGFLTAVSTAVSEEVG
jgi:putative transposase